MDAPWHIRMIGGLRAERGEQVIEHFRSERIAALLAYLAHHCEQSIPREVLIELLWPNSEPDVGRNNLRVALSHLRRQFEPPGVVSGTVIRAVRSSVQLSPDAIETDVVQFEAALKTAASASSDAERAKFLSEAVELYQGEFLAGFYEDWILPEQRRLADLYFQAVRRLAAHFERAEEWERALDYARRAVAVDPLREDAHQDLMRLLVAAGQPFAALRQYRELERILKEELDVAPSATTRALLHEIQRRAASGLPSDSEFPSAVLTLLVADVECPANARMREDESSEAVPTEPAHDILRDLLTEFPNAEEIPAATGSFVIGFARPTDSVRFALLGQSRLRALGERQRPGIRVNMGIHLGQVFVEEEEDTPRDILDMQIDLASRLTALASGGQILTTRGVFDNARQIFNGRLVPGVGKLSWLSHGLFLLRGFEEPLAICEVGEKGAAPLHQPADCEAGKSVAVPGTELVLGWRPAVEQAIPDTEWVLEEKLGEGGFGEVWRAQHSETSKTRVFKFCFRADRLRSLKREMTLFRLLKETLGDRLDIARLCDVQFEAAPYYLEIEDSPGGNLAEWLERQGGCDRVPLNVRLAIVAQIATALAAAHSVGVIHKDVKPSNVLVEEQGDGLVRIRLTDFGIGEVTDRDVLLRAGITVTGFTETISSPSRSGYSGTRLYMAPELLAGQPPSIQSDIYSLGVLLYQLVRGDLSRPITTDWDRQVRDPLLRDDLHHCVAGDPAHRWGNADDLGGRLRSLSQRRRRRRWVRMAQAAVAMLVVVALVAGALSWLQFSERRQAELTLAQETALRKVSDEARERSERERYFTNINLAENLIETGHSDRAKQILAGSSEEYRNWEWGRLQYLCSLDRMTLKSIHHVNSLAFSPDGKRLVAMREIWDVDTGQKLLTLEGHTAEWHSAAFSPDGRRLVTGSEDRTAKVWDADTGGDLLTLKGHSDWVRGVAFSPDGTYIATASWDATAKLWDAKTGEELRTFTGHGGAVDAVAFGPNGRLLATGSYDNTARLWDVPTGRELRTFEGHFDPVVSVAFSPDGNCLATGSRDTTARLWDLDTGGALLTFPGHTLDVFCVAFSPDGKRLATVSDDRAARLWDTATGRSLVTLNGHTNWARSVAFSPNGRFLATGSYDNTAKLWDLETGGDFRRLQGHTGLVNAIAFSPDGNSLVTGGVDSAVRFWNPQTGCELLTLDGIGGSPGSLALSAEGKSLATGSGGTAKLWDVETVRELRMFREQTSGVLCVAFSPDGKHIATGTRFGKYALWDARTGQLENLGKHRGQVCSVAFGSEGKRLVTGSHDGAAKLWDVDTYDCIRTFEGHHGAVASVAFDSAGRRVATASLDGTAKLWDLESGRELRTLKRNVRQLFCVAFSRDGKLVAAGADDGAVAFWDTETGQESFALKGHSQPVRTLAFSPDGNRLATGSSDGTAKLWSLETRSEMRTFKGRRFGVNSVAFSPNGKQLATGSEDTTARLWDAETGREQRRFKGHSQGVTSVAFSPDGKRLATASMDNTTKLWNTETGHGLRGLEGIFRPGGFVAFSPDGGSLVTGSRDGTTRAWDLATGGELSTSPAPGATGAAMESIAFGPDGKCVAIASRSRPIRLWDVETGRELRGPEDADEYVSLAFSPSSRHLAGGHGDGSIALWNVETGQKLWSVKGHVATVYSLVFSPDGERLVSVAHRDQAVRLWDAKTGRQVMSLSGHLDEIRSLAFSPNGKLIATGGADNTAIVWPCFPWKEDEYPGNSDMPFEERVEIYKRAVWKRRSEAMRRVSPVSRAQRIPDAATYSPEVPVRMKLELEWGEDAPSVTVVEKVPEGWTVETMTKDKERSTKNHILRTRVEGNTIVWDVAPWTSPGVTLEYVATPSAECGFYPVAFAGAFIRSGSAPPLRIDDTWFSRPGVLVFQEGAFPDPEYQGCQDAHIKKFHADFNTGGCVRLEDTYSLGGTENLTRILMRFDLSSLPSTFSLRRAELRLFAFGEGGHAGNFHTVYLARLLNPWREGRGTDTNGSPAQEGDVTFNSPRHGLETWERPGALGLTDVAQWESSAITHRNWPEWITFDVTESVSDFLTTPSLNYGWKISQDRFRGLEGSKSQFTRGVYTYKSSEAPEVPLRPMLVIIPEDDPRVMDAARRLSDPNKSLPFGE